MLFEDFSAQGNIFILNGNATAHRRKATGELSKQGILLDISLDLYDPAPAAAAANGTLYRDWITPKDLGKISKYIHTEFEVCVTSGAYSACVMPYQY